MTQYFVPTPVVFTVHLGSLASPFHRQLDLLCGLPRTQAPLRSPNTLHHSAIKCLHTYQVRTLSPDDETSTNLLVEGLHRVPFLVIIKLLSTKHPLFTKLRSNKLGLQNKWLCVPTTLIIAPSSIRECYQLNINYMEGIRFFCFFKANDLKKSSTDASMTSP